MIPQGGVATLSRATASLASAALSDDAYLRIRRVTKRFDSFTALRDVSLDIREGEFVCFLGPSGCGKTTLLRAIAGLDIQTLGTIHQAGRDISALPPEDRDFGIVFQSYALFPNLTVRRNIAFGLQNRGLPRAEIDRRVAELLGLIGLADKADRYPAQLSGGQQQRVALARALAPRPGLILLDEPLSALDAKVRIHLRHELKQLQARLGVTTIMVTHDQDEALSLADRIVVMNMGVVEQVGTPAEIYDHPATRFVADFVGAMTFLPGAMMRGNRVRLGGAGDAAHELRTGDHPDLAGQPVTVAIRPEDVVPLDDHAEAAPAINRLDTRIAAIEYQGAFARIRLCHDALGDAALLAQFPQALVRRRGLSVGQSLPVCLPQDRIRVFAGGAAHG
ncbi:putative 2-aminoethylphosphonate ABC transporter ATP-binding protein [Paracoccus sp. p4-l81]|uniref:putative 2-aminoethylphosphonate ABC transporter ATP-binding protein n=1 Tax=unclassified Paracoccus (in: a-proteobacteria) TaxID=2688777 RepID=UPI0035BA1B9E